MNPEMITVKPEVREALAAGRAVVALESTIISHGLPYPENLKMAAEVEAIVRENGAIPATIGIIAGVPTVGLSEAEVELLATAEDVAKVSRRDLGWAIARKNHGATTVAGTMLLAHAAGIRFFATGGIGGVHRGAAQSFDISADLTELGRTPVAVVSAGAKAILDIPLTLEYLETQGVPVVGFQTTEFPAFYTRSSGGEVTARVDSAWEAAGFLKAHWGLDLGGIVIANPIPEESALEQEFVEGAIAVALAEAEKRKVSGKELTPYLLTRLLDLTGGRSLEANLALVRHNAQVAAEIAAAYGEMTTGGETQ